MICPLSCHVGLAEGAAGCSVLQERDLAVGLLKSVLPDSVLAVLKTTASL